MTDTSAVVLPKRSKTNQDDVEFMSKAKELKDDFTTLTSLSLKMGGLDKGEKARYETKEYPNGLEVGRKDLKHYFKEHKAKIDTLVVLYKQKGKNKQKGKKKAANGLKSAAYYDSRISEFIKLANLGPAYEKRVDATGKEVFVEVGKLSDHMKLLTDQKIGSQTLLNTIFNVHVRQHPELKFDNKQFFRPSPIMTQLFRPDLDRIRRSKVEEFERIKLLKSRGDPSITDDVYQSAERKVQFDPDRLTHGSLQTFTSSFRDTTKQNDPKMLEFLKSDAVKQELEREQKIASDTLSKYRAEDDAKKAAKAKEQAAAAALASAQS